MTCFSVCLSHSSYPPAGAPRRSREVERFLQGALLDSACAAGGLRKVSKELHSVSFSKEGWTSN